MSDRGTAFGRMPFEDDDDYDAGSGGFIPKFHFPVNNPNGEIWPTLPNLTNFFDYDTGTHFIPKFLLPIDDPYTENGSTLIPNLTSVDISYTTEHPMHNFTDVKGANAQFILYDVLMPTIGTIVLLMNLAVVISSGLILKGGAQPRTTYLFLGNVAMADLVTSVATLFGQHYPRDKRTEMICIIGIGMIVSSTLASIWSVLLIGIDRFFYIVRALSYQQHLTPCRARCLIIFTWVLGLVIGFMPITGWIGTSEGGRYCWFIKLAPNELILITAIVGCLPIVIITILYSVILYHALRKVQQLKRADYEASVKHVPKEESSTQMRMFRGGQSIHENNQGQNKRTTPKKFRAIMVVALTTGSFIITWVPYLIASAMYVFCMKRAKSPEECKVLALAIASPLAILGFANSLINPLIYAWWHKGFREFVCTKILRRKRQQHQGSSNSRRFTRKDTTMSNSSTKTTISSSSASNDSKPPSRKISGTTEGPYIGENEDTHL